MPTIDDDPAAAPLDWLEAKPGVKWQRHGTGVLAAWVADMDFRPAPAITDHIRAVLDAGDLGYRDWFRSGWDPAAVTVRAAHGRAP